MPLKPTKLRNSWEKVRKSEKNRKFATYFAVVSLDAKNQAKIII